MDGTEYCFDELEGELYLLCMLLKELDLCPLSELWLITLFGEFLTGAVLLKLLPEPAEPFPWRKFEPDPSETRLLLYDGLVFILGLL